MLGSLHCSVFRASDSLLMVSPSSSHWLSLLLRNNSRAFIPRKLLELGSEPTVSGTVVEGSSSTDVSQRLLSLWFWGFSGVESSLLLPPLLLLLPRVLGGLVSPFLPIVSSLCLAVSSLAQSSLLGEERGHSVKEITAIQGNHSNSTVEREMARVDYFTFSFCLWVCTSIRFLSQFWGKGGVTGGNQMCHTLSSATATVLKSKTGNNPTWVLQISHHHPHLSSAASAASVLSSSSFFSRLLFSSRPNRSKISSSNAWVILFWALYLLSTACS